jgi:hypothetical protein
MKADELFAFWRYDQFPYVLGGTVERMRPDGDVRTVEYGYMWFKPIKLMPLESGKALYAKLDKLCVDRRRALRAFEKEWTAKALALFPDLPGL